MLCVSKVGSNHRSLLDAQHRPINIVPTIATREHSQYLLKTIVRCDDWSGDGATRSLTSCNLIHVIVHCASSQQYIYITTDWSCEQQSNTARPVAITTIIVAAVARLMYIDNTPCNTTTITTLIDIRRFQILSQFKRDCSWWSSKNLLESWYHDPDINSYYESLHTYTLL